MTQETQKSQLNIPVVSGSALIADFLGWEKYEGWDVWGNEVESSVAL